MSFSPYVDNGGTCVSIAGKGYAIVASETRLSAGYHIFTREQSKLFKLTPKVVLGSTGCWCDVLTFAKVIESRIKNYSFEHNRTISVHAAAQLISNMLYYKRFFPYYITNMVVGLDDEGQGFVYRYDPVGSFEEVGYCSGGTSNALIQPFLDNQVGKSNINGGNPGANTLSKEEAIKIIKDAFVSSGERDIYVGDYVHMKIITLEGIEDRTFNLRKD